MCVMHVITNVEEHYRKLGGLRNDYEEFVISYSMRKLMTALVKELRIITLDVIFYFFNLLSI